MPLSPREKDLAAQIAALVHSERHAEAARMLADISQIDLTREQSNDPKRHIPILLSYLHDLLETDGFVEAAQVLWTPTQFNPNPTSTQQVWKLFQEADTGLLMGAAKMSKCLKVTDLCRTANGGLMEAQHVRVGDTLMGDDGTPRKVLETVRGREPMFEIKADHSPAFSCTQDHVLTLICTWTRKNHGGWYGTSSGYTPGKVVDVPLSEYLTWSSTRKRAYRLFVKPAPMREQALRVDPYIYGAWLGDGTAVRAELTSPAGPMQSAWRNYWEGAGFRVVQSKPISWAVRGQVAGMSIWPTRWFQESACGGIKRIYPQFLYASEAQRLALLAGLVDSDGTPRGAGYGIVTKWPELADDIETLARSLGFLVSRTIRAHGIKSIGFSANYTHLLIRGACERIPTREKRIRRRAHKSLTDGVITTRFTVTPIGDTPYAGFVLDGNHRFLLGSGIVTHNSFSMGVRLFLEWVRDPEYTSIRVVGPSEDHLQENLFSHLVSLHQNSSLPMPGSVQDLFIGLDRRNQVSAIRGVVVPKGNNKKAGRLQGGHRKPRVEVHPVFGPLSRMFVFLDEVENIPMGIWQDIDNVLSEIEKGGQGFKIFGAYNPSNAGDEVAKRAEPPFGWGDFNPEIHFRWKSVRGWDVLRLDGEQSDNVLAGKVIYPGLQTRDGLERIAANAGGRNAPGYMTMGRGAYPHQGIEATIIPSGMLPKWRGEYIWYQDPQPISSTDLALEGGDGACHTIGSWGLASGIKYPPSLEFPKGRTVMFKSPAGQITPRWGLQANQQFILPKGDTVVMKNAVLDVNRKSGTRPEYYACDRTGAGSGVADLLRSEWSSTIHDVNYTSGASETKIMQEDSKVCKEEYERIFTELWFALRLWGEFGYLLISPAIDMSKLTQQLVQRRFSTRQGRKCVESKKDYKARGFESPNEADSLTLLVHAARMGSGVIPSMRGASADLPGADDDEDWNSARYPGGVRIDASNQSDHLDLGEHSL